MVEFQISCLNKVVGDDWIGEVAEVVVEVVVEVEIGFVAGDWIELVELEWTAEGRINVDIL